VPAARVTAVVRARRLPGYLCAKSCIADEADKIEVRLLKAEQANWWRIVAATSLVTRPRIFIIAPRAEYDHERTDHPIIA
jgi:hypothetical protein